VVLDGKAVLARFLNDERRGEEVHDQRVFEQLRARGVIDEFHRTPPGVYFEGVGDALFDPQRRLMWMGFGQRSSRCAHHTIEQFFGIATVSLELVDPCYYHLNTSLCLLSGGEILYYPQAFTDQGREQIEYLARDRLIAVSPDDAAGLGVNAVCIGRELVLGHCSPVLREQLRALGYRVHEVPLGAFHRAGGAACCLTLPLHHRSRPRVLGAQRLAP
jgi:N-dimethylarginine dimethylaminohydrolase